MIFARTTGLRWRREPHCEEQGVDCGAQVQRDPRCEQSGNFSFDVDEDDDNEYDDDNANNFNLKYEQSGELSFNQIICDFH